MKLSPTRSAQYPLSVSFTGAWNNWVIDSVDLTAKTLGSSVANSTDPSQAGLTGPVANTIVFDCIPLPPGAVISSASIIVETAYAGSTAATLSLGKAGATTALLNAIDLKTAGRTGATLTDVTTLMCQDGSNLRMTLAYTVANATAGKFRLRIDYVVDGRAQEVQVS